MPPLPTPKQEIFLSSSQGFRICTESFPLLECCRLPGLQNWFLAGPVWWTETWGGPLASRGRLCLMPSPAPWRKLLQSFMCRGKQSQHLQSPRLSYEHSNLYPNTTKRTGGGASLKQHFQLPDLRCLCLVLFWFFTISLETRHKVPSSTLSTGKGPSQPKTKAEILDPGRSKKAQLTLSTSILKGLSQPLAKPASRPPVSVPSSSLDTEA